MGPVGGRGKINHVGPFVGGVQNDKSLGCVRVRGASGTLWDRVERKAGGREQLLKIPELYQRLFCVNKAGTEIEQKE